MFMWTGHFANRDEEDNGRAIINVSKLTPFPSDKFRAVPSTDKDRTDAISFLYSKRSGWFLTCKQDICFIEPRRKTINFERKSSFFPLKDLWFVGYTAFESTVKAGWYLRIKSNRLILDRYDGTMDFKEEASFKVDKLGENREMEMSGVTSVTNATCSRESLDCLSCSQCNEQLSETSLDQEESVW